MKMLLIYHAVVEMLKESKQLVDLYSIYDNGQHMLEVKHGEIKLLLQKCPFSCYDVIISTEEQDGRISVYHSNMRDQRVYDYSELEKMVEDIITLGSAIESGL